MPQIARCHCCGASAKLLVVANDRNRKLSAETFSYYECPACGLVFLDPLPSDLARYYEGGYQKIPRTVDELRVLAEPERYRLAPVLRHVKEGSLLEIGPWIGIFSINAKDAGFDVDVIEMNAEAAAFLDREVKVNVCRTNEPAHVLNESQKLYDVIALWHSLEHLPQPWQVIEAASRRLKPHGILLVAIPNIASLQFRKMRERWFHLDAPRHIYFWSPTALSILASRFGLRTVELATDDELSGALNRSGWISYIRESVRIPILRGIAALAAAPIFCRLTRGGHSKLEGAGMTAVFQLAGAQAPSQNQRSDGRSSTAEAISLEQFPATAT